MDSGICSVSGSANVALVAFPGRQIGQLQLLDLSHLSTSIVPPATFPSTATSPISVTHTPHTAIIQAHTSPLAVVTISDSGFFLASASVKGSNFRTFLNIFFSDLNFFNLIQFDSVISILFNMI